MKKALCVLIAIISVFAVVGCSPETKTLHCDSCSKEVTVEKDSNMEEEWTIFCKECDEKLFGGEAIIDDN